MTAIDVTERKRASDELEATREFLDTIIENVPAALFAKDPISRKYILLNRAGELLFGCPRETFIGKNVGRFSARGWLSQPRRKRMSSCRAASSN